jgi:excisionase family DNA binding protein
MTSSFVDSKGVRRKQPHPPNAPTYPSVEHLAHEIGVSRHACYAAIRKGLIPHIKIGRRIILPRTAISEWLKNAGREGRGLDQTQKS